jgi:hypothetical protein
MICAAVSGPIATSARNEVTKYSHGSSGMRVIVIPLQRMQIMVAIRLIEVPTVPTPVRSSDSVQ